MTVPVLRVHAEPVLRVHADLLYCTREYSFVHCSVGWSDLALFCDFRKATHFCWSDIFLGGQFQKSANFTTRPTHAWQTFHFQKKQGPLKWISVVENFQSPFLYIEEQSPKINLKLKLVKYFLFFKNGQNGFDLKNSKTIFWSISSVFAFKQAKEHILIQVKPWIIKI